MGENSGIQWTDHTFNIVWGCTEQVDVIDGRRVMSPACGPCYAKAFAKRLGLDIWGAAKPRRILSESYWRAPLKWNRAAEKAGKRARVFCSSMADVFEDHPAIAEQRERLWPLIAETPWLDWQLLTKRPHDMLRFAPASWAKAWPANVWAGTTVEDQARADLRVPYLIRVPAVVRFLSIEPMVGPIILQGDDGPMCSRTYLRGVTGDQRIHWVIVGGQSGPKAPILDRGAVRSLLAQCRGALTAAFVKQMGEAWAWDTNTHDQDSHGGTPELWDADLRLREMPRPA